MHRNEDQVLNKIAIIVPAYNAANKLGACLESLDALSRARGDVEVIFVDDASTDGTADVLAEYSASRPWARALRMPENTGSPSAPRNLGVARADAEYVFFLDVDDEVLVDGLERTIRAAETTGADLVRAPLVRDDGVRRTVMNRIETWSADLDRAGRAREIIARQSTTCPSLIRRSLLVEHGVEWPVGHRMGEDTVFLADVLGRAERIEYVDEPNFVYHVAAVAGERSSTQQYHDRELRDHLAVWTHAIERLAPLGIDYLALRGQVAVQAMLRALHRFNRRGISREGFELLHGFFQRHAETISGFGFDERLSTTRRLILDGDYDAFTEAIKPRLLIAGYDLKFIREAVPALQERFQIQLDEWTGHEAHDEARSLRLLAWADVIHCEWLLGNAVWYSQRKRPDQRLVVRMHRFELTRDYGLRLETDAVDRFIAVSVNTLEEMQERFAFPRERVRLVPNFIDVPSYAVSDDPERVFSLAMVGSVPALKGYHRALELLADLRRIDARYTLTVYGKTAKDLPWLLRDEAERAYFAACEQYIADHGLEPAVEVAGWVDTRTALARHGFVLSTSDLESFHVAPAEAFAAGNIGLFLPWRGAEYVYPERYIVPDVAAMRDRVLEYRDLDRFEADARAGRELVASRYSLEGFVDDYAELVEATW